MPPVSQLFAGFCSIMVSFTSFQELGQIFWYYFAAQRETIPALDHLLTVRQQQQEIVQAYIDWFNKEAMKLPNLSDREHIQGCKDGLCSLSLTKILATKWLYSVDDRLDVVHEFIKGKISVQSKRDHLENQLGKNKNKHPFRMEFSRPSVHEWLTFRSSRPYR